MTQPSSEIHLEIPPKEEDKIPYLIHWRDCEVIITLEGILSSDECRAYEAKIFGSSKFDNLKSIILDASNLQKMSTDMSSIYKSAAIFIGGSIMRTLKVAVIINNNKQVNRASFAFAKLIQQSSANIELEVFKDFSKANHWIDQKFQVNTIQK